LSQKVLEPETLVGLIWDEVTSPTVRDLAWKMECNYLDVLKLRSHQKVYLDCDAEGLHKKPHPAGKYVIDKRKKDGWGETVGANYGRHITARCGGLAPVAAWGTQAFPR